MDTKKLRQKILDLAIRGKLVPQYPNDEPASVLLERIRAEKERLIKEGKIKGSKKLEADTPDDDEVQFEIPENWEWCNIKDVTSKITDGTHNSPPNSNKGAYKYITAKNIKPQGIVLNDISYVTEDIHNEIYARCNPEYGDILYIKDGATTGVVTINNLHEPFSLLSSVALIKPLVEISNKYLLYYLQSSVCFNSVRESMKGVGITRITLKQIEKWNIPLPPFAEQHRIVAAIEKWFALIDILENAKDDLQTSIAKAKSKILDLAIHGKLVPQDPNDEPAIELLKRINPKFEPCDDTDCPYELPENWEWTKLGDISNYGNVTTESVENISDNSWILELEDIEKDSAKVIQFLRKKERGIKGVRHLFNKDDILYSKLRTYLNKVLMANETGYCTTEIIPITVCQDVFTNYVCHVLRSPYFLDYTEQCGYGVKMPRLSTNDARKGFIPLPPYPEQLRIVAKIEEIFAVLDNIKESIEA